MTDRINLFSETLQSINTSLVDITSIISQNPDQIALAATIATTSNIIISTVNIDFINTAIAINTPSEILDMRQSLFPHEMPLFYALNFNNTSLDFGNVFSTETFEEVVTSNTNDSQHIARRAKLITYGIPIVMGIANFLITQA